MKVLVLGSGVIGTSVEIDGLPSKATVRARIACRSTTAGSISSATNATQGATKYGDANLGSSVQNQKNIGINASPAPAGAGTPVRKPADLCGWWLSSNSCAATAPADAKTR